MTEAPLWTEICAEDMALIAGLTRAQAIAMAVQEEEWADLLVRVGRWPSERNGSAVSLWRARAAACREAADGKA